MIKDGDPEKNGFIRMFGIYPEIGIKFSEKSIFFYSTKKPIASVLVECWITGPSGRAYIYFYKTPFFRAFGTPYSTLTADSEPPRVLALADLLRYDPAGGPMSRPRRSTAEILGIGRSLRDRVYSGVYSQYRFIGLYCASVTRNIGFIGRYGGPRGTCERHRGSPMF